MPSIWILLSLIVVTLVAYFSDIIHNLPEIVEVLDKHNKLRHHYYGEKDRWKED